MEWGKTVTTETTYDRTLYLNEAGGLCADAKMCGPIIADVEIRIWQQLPGGATATVKLTDRMGTRDHGGTQHMLTVSVGSRLREEARRDELFARVRDAAEHLGQFYALMRNL
jgi:hypothetical protein